MYKNIIQAFSRHLENKNNKNFCLVTIFLTKRVLLRPGVNKIYDYLYIYIKFVFLAEKNILKNFQVFVSNFIEFNSLKHTTTFFYNYADNLLRFYRNLLIKWVHKYWKILIIFLCYLKFKKTSEFELFSIAS